MRRMEAILAAAMALALTGCALRGKQQAAKAVPPPPKPVVVAAPPAPPPKLSIPQTDAQLPPPQPVNLEGLAQVTPAEELPAPAQPPRQPRRTSSSPPRAEPAPAPAVPAQPAETDRPPIKEILSPADLDRFQKETAEYKKETQTLLQQALGRRLNSTQQGLVNRINTFVKDSDSAAEHNDWRLAHELANRAVALARELTGGK